MNRSERLRSELLARLEGRARSREDLEAVIDAVAMAATSIADRAPEEAGCAYGEYLPPEAKRRWFATRRPCPPGTRPTAEW
jgi:hypothetical protein